MFLVSWIPSTSFCLLFALLKRRYLDVQSSLSLTVLVFFLAAFHAACGIRPGFEPMSRALDREGGALSCISLIPTCFLRLNKSCELLQASPENNILGMAVELPQPLWG